MDLSAHERDHLRALVLSQDVNGVVEFMAAKVDGKALPGVDAGPEPEVAAEEETPSEAQESDTETNDGEGGIKEEDSDTKHPAKAKHKAKAAR